MLKLGKVYRDLGEFLGDCVRCLTVSMDLIRFRDPLCRLMLIKCNQDFELTEIAFCARLNTSPPIKQDRGFDLAIKPSLVSKK